jgi:DNA-binding transcriptional LysR family regulator
MIKSFPVENRMDALMLDLDLLRSFVSVVDTGGFTRAGERVHRTQSTVSQQIIRLEKTLGYPLLHRNGRKATPTEQGERLVSYARRILSLEQEAREVVARPVSEGVLRLGVPEDFAAPRGTALSLVTKVARRFSAHTNSGHESNERQ